MNDGIQVYSNNKGAQSIVYQNYTYRLFRKNKNSGHLVWRCNNKLCSVMVTTNSHINVFIKQNKCEHDHENQTINTELKEIRRAFKRKSQLRLYEKPVEILRQEPCMSKMNIKNINAMKQSMYRERRKLYKLFSASLVDATKKKELSLIIQNFSQETSTTSTKTTNDAESDQTQLDHELDVPHSTTLDSVDVLEQQQSITETKP